MLDRLCLVIGRVAVFFGLVYCIINVHILFAVPLIALVVYLIRTDKPVDRDDLIYGDYEIEIKRKRRK